MGIAFDAATNQSGGTGTSHTFAHTTTGSNRILFVGVLAATDTVTGVTYNGVAMTQVGKRTVSGTSTEYLYVLHNPAAGANNVVISASGSIALQGRSVSYTGAKQTSTVDNSTTGGAASGTSLALTLTPTVTGCWAVAIFRNEASNAATAGAGTTLRAIDGAQSFIMGDTNAAIAPAASTTLNYQWSGSTPNSGVMASFAPVLTDTGAMFALF